MAMEMTFERFCALTREEQLVWLDSDDHLYNCIGYSEGQQCCLDMLIYGEEGIDDSV